MTSGQTGSKSFRVTPTAAGTITNTVNLVTLPVDPNPSNNSVSISTRVTSSLRTESVGELNLTYKSLLAAEPEGGGSVTGRIVWNGANAQETTGSGEFIYRANAVSGTNRVEAHWTPIGEAGGTWRFDFRADKAFVPGSFYVESGQVVSMDGHSIVFALRAGAPSLRFTFEADMSQTGEPRR
jgi:hypothetical protein